MDDAIDFGNWETIPFGVPFERSGKTLIAVSCICGGRPPCSVTVYEWSSALQEMIGDPSQLPMNELVFWLAAEDPIQDNDLTDIANAGLRNQTMEAYRLAQLRGQLLCAQTNLAYSVIAVLQRWIQINPRFVDELATVIVKHGDQVEDLLDRFAPAQEPADRGSQDQVVAAAMKALTANYTGTVVANGLTVTMVIDLDTVRAAMAAEEAVV